MPRGSEDIGVLRYSRRDIFRRAGWLRGFGITSELKVRPPKKKEKVIGAAALRGVEVRQFLKKIGWKDFLVEPLVSELGANGS